MDSDCLSQFLFRYKTTIKTVFNKVKFLKRCRTLEIVKKWLTVFRTISNAIFSPLHHQENYREIGKPRTTSPARPVFPENRYALAATRTYLFNKMNIKVPKNVLDWTSCRVNRTKQVVTASRPRFLITRIVLYGKLKSPPIVRGRMTERWHRRAAWKLTIPENPLFIFSSQPSSAISLLWLLYN